jgi:hypothetical protein
LNNCQNGRAQCLQSWQTFHVGFFFARFRGVFFPIVFKQLIDALDTYKVDIAKVDVADAVHVVMV